MARLPQPSRRALTVALVVPLLAVGLVSFFMVRDQQGGGAVVSVDQRVGQLTLAGVDRVIRNAPDPIGHEPAIAVRCVPAGTGDLENPWDCVLRYPTGRIIEYAVTINSNGSYVGDHQVVLAPPPAYAAPGTIRGCCISVP